MYAHISDICRLYSGLYVLPLAYFFISLFIYMPEILPYSQDSFMTILYILSNSALKSFGVLMRSRIFFRFCSFGELGSHRRI